MRMVRLAIATTATLTLVGTMASGAVAQSPSPDPPPWFGGRVEMPEHGFAVTVPDGWVAFDPAGDVDEQTQRAFMVLTHDAPVDEVDDMAEELSHDVAEALSLDVGAQLLLMEDTMESACVFQVGAATKIGLREFADFMSSHLHEYPYVTDAETPRPIQLPAGPGYLVEATFAMPDDLGPRPLIYQLVERDRSLLAVVCNGLERPDDDWRSIAGTFEWLPTE